jgi:hypothetical protein
MEAERMIAPLTTSIEIALNSMDTPRWAQESLGNHTPFMPPLTQGTDDRSDGTTTDAETTTTTLTFSVTDCLESHTA